MGITHLEALRIIEEYGLDAGGDSELHDAIRTAIKALEQQQKTGQWVDKKMTIKGGHGLAYGRYGCSVCKKKQPSKSDFCPCCGADMRGEDNDNR